MVALHFAAPGNFFSCIGEETWSCDPGGWAGLAKWEDGWKEPE
jgi:hypothetical protein